MTSQLITPENTRVCSVSGFFALLLALAYPRFDLPCQISLRLVQSVAPVGRKAEKMELKNRPVSKNNTALHFPQRWR